MSALVVAIASLFGLIVGSFLNVVIHRVPRKESVVAPRSRCPHCATELRAVDNVPVVSWLVLRGRCRTCAGPIAVRYPLVEAGCAALFGVTAARFGVDAAVPAFCVWGGALLAISLIDLEHLIVPNRVLYPALFACAPLLVAAAVVDGEIGPLRSAALGGMLGFAILFVIHVASPKGMGFGDVRLAGLNGVLLGWLGLDHVALGLFLAFVYASVVGVALIASKRRGRKDAVPFGPFLALGALSAVLVGEPILRAYTSGL